MLVIYNFTLLFHPERPQSMHGDDLYGEHPGIAVIHCHQELVQFL